MANRFLGDRITVCTWITRQVASWGYEVLLDCVYGSLNRRVIGTALCGPACMGGVEAGGRESPSYPIRKPLPLTSSSCYPSTYSQELPDLLRVQVLLKKTDRADSSVKTVRFDRVFWDFSARTTFLEKRFDSRFEVGY